MSEAATTPEELANKLTSLQGPDLEHLLALQESWGILADLSFSDLLLCAPMRLEPDDAPLDGSFVVLGQMRPTTSQTLLRDDLVGGVIRQGDPSLLGRAFSIGELVDGESLSQGGSEPVRLQCIPVRRSGRVIAVLVRESPLAVGRRPGLLERTYASLFGRFAQMITDGLFPYSLGGQPYELEETVDDLPRVGDGVMLLDEHGRIEFTSPNAVNALHRLGVRASLAGIRLHELGVDERAVDEAYAHGLPTVEEVERSVGAVVLLRCLPLLAAGGVDGVLVLCRDVTDLRRRDRLLVSKDATIREIHHRVKNNLQTVSSLLRLQARRAGEHEGRQALTEAERRIRSIAVVHDFLSRDVKDQVSFSEIVVALIQLAEE
jgi:two-component system, sensor histidine kinase PdtaS